LLIGPRTLDDAGIFEIDDKRSLVQTLDFFTPIVDDPFLFGKIAASNALSDVYAMGGTPLTAMNIVCFPAKTLDHAILRAIIRGANEILKLASCALAGGHTVDDPVVKFGLAVTGVVDTSSIWANAGARPGDALVLTKALGTGIIATAIGAQLCDPEHAEAAIDSMTLLNKHACYEARAIGMVHGATDVTGFGLLGHAVELAQASGVVCNIDSSKVQLFDGALEYASMGLVPEGTHRNAAAYRCRVESTSDLTLELRDLLYDSQTSGGLLLAMEPRSADRLIRRLGPPANIIGNVVAAENGRPGVNLR